ncbi:MAG: hypothetical protein KC496_02655 [Anaerolineae bacterium]|nr:hypothetical protein [Anaerolineae bacterium]
MDMGMVLMVGIGLLLLVFLVSRFFKQPETTFGDESAVPTRTTASSDERIYPFPDTNQYPSSGGVMQDPIEEDDEIPYDQRV